MIFRPTSQQLKLGLGGAGLGNLFAAITDAAARDVLEAALASGCRTFDTAPHYGNGLSEHRFGQVLRTVSRDSFVLSTKVGRVLRPDRNAARQQNGYVDVLPCAQVWDYSAAGVRRSVEDSLQRLGMGVLDVAYIHDCDALTHGARYPQVLAQVVNEALPELARMKAEGLLRHVGLGVNDVQVCLDVLRKARLDTLMLAGRYSLIDHTALAELLPMCEQQGVRVALAGAFNSGILASGVRNVPAGQAVRFNYAAAPQTLVDRVAAVEDVCDTFNVPLRAAALQFPLAHPAIEIVIAGPQSVSHWRDAMAMMQHPVPPLFWAALRSAALVPTQAPLPACR